MACPTKTDFSNWVLAAFQAANSGGNATLQSQLGAAGLGYTSFKLQLIADGIKASWAGHDCTITVPANIGAATTVGDFIARLSGGLQ